MKNTEKTYYKVVKKMQLQSSFIKKHFKRIGFRGNVKISALESQGPARYSTGRWTHSHTSMGPYNGNPETGKLFIFKNITCAKKFAKDWNAVGYVLSIYECKARDVIMSENWFPQGTLLADAVKLIREIKYK